MHRMVLFVVVVFSTSLGLAQTSPNYEVSESVFNSGGNPDDGVVLQSSNYTVSLDALGQGITTAHTSSGSYSAQAGFPYAYPPPHEVVNLQILSPTLLTWDPENSPGTYNVYRGQLSDLGSGYGSCVNMGTTYEQYQDTEPYSGQAYFYLITAANLLAEEGTLGYGSSGSERANTTPCY